MSVDPEVSGDIAGKVLARAAELDATGGSAARLSQLREAAGEAGISMSAFDRAAEELVPHSVQHAPSSAEPAVKGRSGRSLLLMAAAGAVLLCAVVVLVVGFFLAAPVR